MEKYSMLKKIVIIFFCFFITSCSTFYQSDELWIKNAQNENIYVKVDGLNNISHHKLAILQHGLASNMQHQAIQMAKQAFLDHNYVVIMFDSRYSLGNSGNNVEKVSLTTFEEDLQTVINWAKTQPFYSQPFALAGHSLGGASVLQYSAKKPSDVAVLLPITPVISGDLWEENCMANLTEFCRQWKQKGTYKYTDENNHKTAVISYDVVTDSKNFNAYQLAPYITAQTLLIAAENDIIINPNDINELSQLFPVQTRVNVISDSGHNFEKWQNQYELYSAMTTFLK